MPNYFLQANLYLILFYVIYAILLSRETFFKWNRSYLLLAVFVSLIVPVVPLPSLVKEASVVENLKGLGEPVLLIAPIEETSEVSEKPYSIEFWLWAVYFGVALIFVLRFFGVLWKMHQLAKRYGIQKKQGYAWIQMPDQTQVFSFFYYIFWGMQSELSPEEQDQIIQHELVHARQWHSLDIIALEWLQIIFWFNPVCYFLKHSMRQVHEYLADTAVLQQGINKQNYATLLVQQSLLSENLTLSNTFFNQTLLKSRIKMMNQKTSQAPARLKFVLVLPVLIICVLVAACSKNQLENVMPKFQSKSAYIVPEGYSIFKSQQVTSKSLNKYKFIFSKGTNYKFDLIALEGNDFNADDVTMNVYRMKDGNTIDELVASNVNKNNVHTNTFDYQTDKTSMFTIEIKKNDAIEDFTFRIALKKEGLNSPGFAETQKRFPKSKAEEIIDLQGKNSATLSLKKDRLYHFFLNTPIDANQAQTRLSIIKANSTSGNHAPATTQHHYRLVSCYPRKNMEYELKLETNTSLNNYEVLVFSELISK